MINTELRAVRDLLVKNKDLVKSAFKWEDDMMSLAGSTIFTGLGLTADAEQLKECERLLKEHAGALSEFRGHIKLPLLCKMAVSGSPEQYLLHVTEIYGLLNPSKLGSSGKLLAAIILCDHGDAQRYIEKTNDIFRLMKQAHKWLTSEEDMPYAAMLAVSGADAEKLIAEAERCYPVMKEKFGTSNAEAVQSLCHLLALNYQSAEEKCKKVAELYDALKAAKHRFGVGQELAFLGILTMLDVDTSKIVADISEIDDYLKKQKGFGNLSIGSEMRRMYAAMIVVNAYQAAGKGLQGIDNTLAIAVSIEVSAILMMTTLLLIWSI